jgi:8-oxo-dGTP diphosphatase
MGVKDQGLEHSRYRFQVVPRTLIFVTYQDRVLLSMGASNKKIWPNLYNGVGGHIESGETPLAAAKRETSEEVGLMHLSAWKLCGTVIIATEDPLLGILLFVFRAVSQDEHVRGSDEGEPRWVDWKILPPHTLVPDLVFLLPRVLDVPDETSPFFARTFYDNADRLQIVFDE